jgi:CheY-specific phosphatase CheX
MPIIHFDEWVDASVTEVLESMCFLSAEPVREAGAPDYETADGASILRRLEFKGPRTGSFGICTSLPSARMIACNLIGVDPEEVTAEQAAETIGEITNMVCGAFLGRFEAKQAFDLSHPQMDDLAKCNVSPNRISRTFALEEGALTAWMEIEKAHEPTK